MLKTLSIGPIGADTRHPQYQALKGRVHQELLNRLNLDRLSKVKRGEAEPELRGLIVDMLEREHETPLSLAERENLITDVLHELFGLGPLEALLSDPSISDILVNRFNQVYISAKGGSRRQTSCFATRATCSRSSNAS